MKFWVREISWKKALLSSIIFIIISSVIRQVEVIFTMDYYKMPEFYGVWSKIMMPKAGPPPTSFLIMSLVFAFATGLSLALIYYYLKDHLPKEKTKRMLYFADLMIGTSLVFFTLPVYLLFNIPVTLLISWFVSTFVILTLYSWILVKILK